MILGSGWAGYALARGLDAAKFERIVVSPRSHFVFTPLLASTAVGTLEFRAVLEPVRRLAGVAFHQGWADDVDFARRVVRVEANPGDADLSAPHAYTPAVTTSTTSISTASSSSSSGDVGGGGAGARGRFFDVPYDKLVVAVGAYSHTFGISGVREHAHFLRDVSDARRIRLRVLSLFEAAAAPSVSDAERARLLRFAVVGGGPTGIEFAAELHDLVHEDLRRIYPDLMRFVDITVYDIAPAVLPMFDRRLAEYAVGLFRRQGIRVRTETHLDGVRADEESSYGGLRLRIREDEDEVPAGLVVWSTGLMQNPLVEKLVAKEIRIPGGGGSELLKDPKTGGIVTDAHLRARLSSPPAASEGGTVQEAGVPSATLPDVFVIGDCAVVESNPALPKTAQVASQQAAYLARQLNRGGGPAVSKPFQFRNWGTMAYLGGWKAIHQSSADELRGWAAWALWRTAYLTYSMSVRNKIMVPVYWAISWLFGRDISRF